MQNPIDVPTRETVAFLAPYLRPGADVVEVGCGDGHVASELMRRGYGVIGVDSDPTAAARAQERGVRAEVANWPAYDGPAVDAIVYTRSLHHINPLRGAIRRSRELVRPAGSLLVEDFAFDETNEATINWFLGVLRSQAGKAHVNPVHGAFATTLLQSDDPVLDWDRDHAHELHTVAAMKVAIAEHFTVTATQSVPYLYRYLIPVLSETAQAAAFVDHVLQEEAELGKGGDIVLVGRRIVGTA